MARRTVVHIVTEPELTDGQAVAIITGFAANHIVVNGKWMGTLYWLPEHQDKYIRHSLMSPTDTGFNSRDDAIADLIEHRQAIDPR